MKLLSLAFFMLTTAVFAQFNLSESSTDSHSSMLKQVHGDALLRSSTLKLYSQRGNSGDYYSDLLDEDTLTIKLFEDVTVTAVRKPDLKQPREGRYWSGTLVGEHKGYLEMYSRNGYLSGTVYTSNIVYKLDGISNTEIRVIELNPSSIVNDRLHNHEEHNQEEHDNEEHDLHIDDRLKRVNNSVKPASIDDPVIIDVMVIYPQSILDLMGGNEAMENEIYYRIAEVNQIFDNSKIFVEYRLVHHQVASSVSANAQSAGDVVTTEVESLRDNYGADIVSFWSDDGSAGSGFNLDGSGDPDDGYNTSKFSLVQSYYTFAHECGHNMGAKHDRQTYYDDSPTNSKLNLTPYYRYGKSFVGYRSIMSYNSCGDVSGGSSSDCERVPYFTNPDIIVNGSPFGVDGDSQTYSVNGPSNNARRINETAPIVALWRSSNTVFYTLNVVEGTGAGEYLSGAVVNIQANTPDEGEVFDKWEGDISSVLDIYSSITTLTINEKDVDIKAVYKPIDYSEDITITVPIKSGSDDVEENGSGSGVVYVTSSDLELTLDGSKGNQVIGLRFQNFPIPKGMIVKNAYMSFVSEASNDEVTNLEITVDTNTKVNSFSTDVFNVSTRVRSSNVVEWAPNNWSVDEVYKTTDISSVIQELLSKDAWSYGDDIVCIIEGSGKRSAYSYEADPNKSASITITFTEGMITGTEKAEGSGVKIYPNPTTSNVYIEGGFTSWDLTSLDGYMNLKGDDDIVDTSVLSSGVYVLRVKTLKGVELYKVVKE